MSSLPLISHHLFVAAMDHNNDRSANEPRTAESSTESNPVSLKVLDWTEPLAEVVARPLRVSSNPAA